MNIEESCSMSFGTTKQSIKLCVPPDYGLVPSKPVCLGSLSVFIHNSHNTKHSAIRSKHATPFSHINNSEKSEAHLENVVELNGLVSERKLWHK